MARILSDTNIWLRTADPGSALHSVAVQSVARLLADGHEVCVCAQNLIEFWAVATRPAEANGLGWSPEETAAELAGIEARFTLLPDLPETFGHWKSLVQAHGIRGKRTHDARLAAVCLSHGVHALLTLNVDDFRALSCITLLDAARPESWTFPASH